MLWKLAVAFLAGVVACISALYLYDIIYELSDRT